ncbi:MAG: cytochrome c peroxidase, partial [Bacteroidota bacterium]
ASCHKPELAFTDGEKKSIARGFDGTVDRNAPTLINSAYSARLFLDLRAEKLEDQIHHVIFNEKEFNTNFFEVFDRLKQSDEYVQLFKKAFPQYADRPLHRYTLATALSSYIISLGSFSSPFDQYVRGEKEEVAPAVKRGFNLFMGKAGCGTCHFAPTFSGLVPPAFHEMESEILGVPGNKDVENPILDEDPGRSAGRVKESFVIYHRSFKTTTVRNIAMTAPYMHNGVYDNLEEVVDFYNRGGGAGMGMDVPYQTLPPDELGLNENEISDLVAFMESLTHSKIDTRRPEKLPAYPEASPFNNRVIGGKY